MIPKPSELKEISEAARSRMQEEAAEKLRLAEFHKMRAVEECFHKAINEFPQKARQAAEAGYNRVQILHIGEGTDDRWVAFWQLENYFKDSGYRGGRSATVFVYQ